MVYMYLVPHSPDKLSLCNHIDHTLQLDGNENTIGANIHDNVLMEATQCIHGSVFTLPYRHTLLQPVSICSDVTSSAPM